MKNTRRAFIKKAALLTGAAGLSSVLPASIQKAFAIDPPRGSTYMDAEHIVILMQENRSFDHCFGTLSGVRGYNDPRAIELPNRNKVWLQSNDKGETYAPFHLDIKNTRATWMHSLPHSWANQVNARNDGRYDQWLNVKQSGTPAYAHMPLTMGYHTRADIPFYYSLADAFTVCDQNFCSALTGTNPNRLYFWTGTVREEQNENSKANVWNDDMDYGTLNWSTFPERLEQNGVSWKCYQNEVSIDTGFEGEEDTWLSNFQDNALEFFAQYHIELHPGHVEHVRKQLNALPGEIDELKKKIAGLPVGDLHIGFLKKQLGEKEAYLAELKKKEAILQPDAFEKLSGFHQNIHRKAFNTNTGDAHYRNLIEIKYDDNGVERQMQIPKGDVLYQFREDVRAGKLPTVSWISAPENFSDHPSAPWYGAWYVSEVMDILTQDPEVWKKTIFILAYDENDGYFDHVPPFVAPHSHKAGTGRVSAGIDTRVEFITLQQEQARHGFPEPFERECSIGLGYRVPLVIASPWTRGGWVNSQVFDHTSTLQFLEHFLSAKTGRKITEPNISDWRRTVCGDLHTVFRPYHGEKMEMPRFVVRDEFLEGIHKARFKKLPSDYNALSAEEIKAFNADPGASPYMPKQEKGMRKSCSLPYQLYAEGKLSADKKTFEIKFEARNEVFGEKALGSPFNVYAPGNYLQGLERDKKFIPLQTWAYAVKAGDLITDSWPLSDFEQGNYHLRVYGPNGFYREFAGNTDDPQLDVAVDYEPGKGTKNQLTGNVLITLNNRFGKACTVNIADNAYHSAPVTKTLKAGEHIQMVIALDKSNHWYDFTIRTDQHDAFFRKFAGRVETGRAGFSDPQMA